jgi:hypothetical protein
MTNLRRKRFHYIANKPEKQSTACFSALLAIYLLYMENCKDVVVTGQQIGAGWSPALSVVKALTALAEAKQRGLRPVYWLADEDHDRVEVASVVALWGDRLARHRFQFSAPAGTAAGWLEWTDKHQTEAQNLWGKLPEASEPTLRGHVMALGSPLWDRGIAPFSPTRDIDRYAIQAELERWRGMYLENELYSQADLLESKGGKLILDPRQQSAWFSLDPLTGRRNRLERGQKCPMGHWLSPGAALRPLMQSLLLPVKAAVLGPAEKTYWQLIEPLWDRVGLESPQILQRPTVFVLSDNSFDISVNELEALCLGQWELFAPAAPLKPSAVLFPEPDYAWGNAISNRYQAEISRLKARLKRLDTRLAKEAAEKRVGKNIERLRQMFFPFNKPQERVLPGWYWLRTPSLLDAMESELTSRAQTYLIRSYSQ